MVTFEEYVLLCVQKLCANIKWRLIDHQKSQRCGLHVHLSLLDVTVNPNLSAGVG